MNPNGRRLHLSLMSVHTWLALKREKMLRGQKPHQGFRERARRIKQASPETRPNE